MKNTFLNFFKLIFGSIFLFILFFSAQPVLAESCGGLQIDAGGGLGSRCSQASPALVELISCLAAQNPQLIITSIGDDPAKFASCSASTAGATCSHDNASCHYGGPLKADGQRTCTDGSHAVDLRATAATSAMIITQVQSCGGKSYFEDGNHVHASVGSCGCDGWPADGSGSIFTPQKICFKPQIPIPGFVVNPSNATECPNGLILDGKGNAIALYINAAYKYGAGVAGIVAMFMIVFASWQWIIASGNSGKIDNAKETITGALIGLAFLLGGNLLLGQISSGLVEFESLSIKPITSKYVDAQLICSKIILENECNQNPNCVFTTMCYTSNDDICINTAGSQNCGDWYTDDGYTCAGGLKCADSNKSCAYYPGGNTNVPKVPCSYNSIKEGKECSCL